jgi:Malectin domain
VGIMRGMGKAVGLWAVLGVGVWTSGCEQQPGTPETEVTVGAAAAAPGLAPQTGVLTQHNDLARTGANLNETVLNTSNVRTGTFGKLHSYPVTGQVYAQPLYVAQAIAGKNVVYLATEANNVYAYNADSPWDLLWSRTSIETPWMSASTCVNTQPLIGISSTPVIDPSTNTIYLTAKRNANGTFKYMLHALDLTTGADKAGSPIDMGLDASGQPLAVTGSGDGTSGGKIVFDPIRHQNRVGLTLSQGVLTVGFASHCDQNNYHGWVLRFDTTSSPIRPLAPYMTNPNTGHGGLWQGGGAFPVDASGNLYMVSGDGRSGTTRTDGTQLANAFIKLTNVGIAGTPTVGSWFMPSDVATLDNGDVDIGSSGPLLIPGTSLLTAGGKNGVMYVVNTTGDSMGHFVAGSPPDTQIVQRFAASSTNGQIVGGPAWWESPAGPRLYVWPGGSTLGAFAFNRSTNLFNTTAVSRGTVTATGGDPQGAQLSLSANASVAGTGIVWATRALGSTGGGGFNSSTPVGGALYAFDAENVATKLWDSTQVGADKLANAPKYIPPTIANGKVYVGTLGAAPSSGGEVAVYGLFNGGSDGGVGGSSGTGGSGGGGGADGGTLPTLTCATVDGGAPQPTNWTYVYSTYFAGTTTGATAGHCSECHGTTLANFNCGPDKDSCYAGLVSVGQITPATPTTSPLADSERSPLAWFGRPTAPPGVLAFMPTDLVVRNAPAVAAVCGWVQAGARDDKANGQTCGAANECASGFCVAGVCCANATCATATVYQVDSGSSSAVSPFSADQFFSGGTARSVTNAITISGVTNPAPQAVYQTERYGASTYTFPSLTPSAAYTVRLHFAELFQTAAGKRVFNVAINGTTVLSQFDIFATAGAAFKAVVREFTANANASGQIVITFTTVTDNATIEGIEILGGSANAAPTIATAASASPTPVAGTSATLAVLGADDGGEANLTYTWATTGTPPAAVAFSANGTNAAKTSTATFTKAGTYAFQVTVKDQGNLTVTSPVTVTVNQTLTSIAVSPATATVNTSGTQQFTATARDQFGTGLAAQPAFAWTTSGGGTISSAGLFTAGTTTGGPFTITAASGSILGTASVTVSSTPTTVYRINCGGSAVSPFAADQFFSGGTARTVTNSIATSGLTNAAPQGVYQSERYGNVTYTLPSLVASASYTVRLHFAELFQTAAGKRKFNVAINGTTVLSNFDIFATTGAAFKATLRDFTTTATSAGQIVIALTTVTDNATIEGIEIIRP